MNRKEVITIDKMIQLSSVTQAMRARDILRSYRIRCAVKRMTSKGKGPCSYGLVIYNDFERALEILEDKGINYVGRAVGGGL